MLAAQVARLVGRTTVRAALRVGAFSIRPSSVPLTRRPRSGSLPRGQVHASLPYQTMNVVIVPAPDGLASERLRALAAQLTDPGSGEATIRQLSAAEAAPARRMPLLDCRTRTRQGKVVLAQTTGG